MSWRPKIVYVFLLAFTLAGCSEFVWPDQVLTQTTRVAPLQASTSLGQTLLSREAGLHGVDIFLTPIASGDGEIRLHLRADAFASTDIAQSDLSLSTVTAPAFYRFTFPAQSQSRLRSYYIYLEMLGSGQVEVGNATADSYLEGALYQDGQPVEAQMTFRLTYEPGWVLAIVALEFWTWVGWLALTTLAFVIPGWAMLLMWDDAQRLSWPEQLGLAIGLSLAIYPILFLGTFLGGVRLGAGYAWLPIIGGVGALAWRSRAVWRWPISIDRLNWWRRSESFWPDVTLVNVLTLIFFTRFWTVRSLLLPLWGDSYDHTLIAQLLVDNDGLFNTWQPYVELRTFTYHFGFHTLVAVMHWLTQLTLPQTTLWVGQILNGLSVLALYPLAMRLGHNRWAGVGAVLIAGLLSPMPMTYANWGRYTQLAGQAILPGAVWLLWVALERSRRDWRLMMLNWLALSGLALAHYRILIVITLFVIAYLLLEARPGHFRRLTQHLFWLALGASLIFMPWFIHTFAGKITVTFAKQLTTSPAEVALWVQQSNIITDLSVYLPVYLWLMLPIAAGWGLWQQRKSVAVVSLWWMLALVAANPRWLDLPGEWALTNFTVFIAAYIPAGVLLGGLVGEVMTRYPRRWLTTGLTVVFIGLGLWGAWQRIGDVHFAEYALATSPDMRAAVWLRANTPPESRIMVNGFLAFGDKAVVGSDGGWWLNLLADRSTTIPPLNYTMEQGFRPDFGAWTRQLYSEVRANGLEAPSALALLQEHGVTHLYIGQRQGRVNTNLSPLLDPVALSANLHFRAIYHQDRVWVFEFCGSTVTCAQ